MRKGNIASITPVGTSHDPAIRKRVLFGYGELPHVTQISQTAFRPGQRVAVHSHPDMFELFVCLEGQGRIIVNGEAHELSPGTYVLCEPGDRHEVVNNGGVDMLLSQLGLLQ